MTKNVPVRSVKKALDLLNLLAFDDVKRQGLTLTSLAEHMKIPINTTHNLLKTMSICGYVAQTESGSYCIGRQARELGRFSHLVAATASPELRMRIEKLCHDLGEAITLATLASGRRVLLQKNDPHQPIRVDSTVVEGKPLFASPTGRVLAAFATNDEVEAILERNGFPGDAWNGIMSRPKLNKALAMIRTKGEALIPHDGGELVSFAVPVLDTDGQLLAALGCYAPEFRCETKRYPDVLQRLRQAATEIVQFL